MLPMAPVTILNIRFGKEKTEESGKLFSWCFLLSDIHKHPKAAAMTSNWQAADAAKAPPVS